jgi:hypothetical protein
MTVTKSYFMDINTSIGLILNFLEKNDSFTFEKDYKKLNWNLITEKDSTEDEQQASILGALQLMERENSITKVEREVGDGKNKKNQYTYVVLNSRKNSPVTIEIGKETATNLVNVVNQFLPMMDINIKERSNIENLGEAEIILLLQVVHFMAQQLNQENEKSEKESE